MPDTQTSLFDFRDEESLRETEGDPRTIREPSAARLPPEIISPVLGTVITIPYILVLATVLHHSPSLPSTHLRAPATGPTCRVHTPNKRH